MSKQAPVTFKPDDRVLMATSNPAFIAGTSSFKEYTFYRKGTKIKTSLDGQSFVVSKVVGVNVYLQDITYKYGQHGLSTQNSIPLYVLVQDLIIDDSYVPPDLNARPILVIPKKTKPQSKKK